MSANNPVDRASTSSDSTADAILDKAMKILKDLVIDWEIEPKQCLELNSRDKKTDSENEEALSTRYRNQSFWRRRVKWTPYAIPRKVRASLPVDDHYSILRTVRFPDVVDVESLRMCLLDRRHRPITCCVQAALPPDGEIDELSEYFAHFVRVDLKMSALAESMYV